MNNFDGPVYGTALENAVSFKEIEAQSTFALLLGNEGEGLIRIVTTNNEKFNYSNLR